MNTSAEPVLSAGTPPLNRRRAGHLPSPCSAANGPLDGSRLGLAKPRSGVILEHEGLKEKLALTRSEFEIVGIIADRPWLSNRQIAKERSVVVGTVNTQLKGIYRKMNHPSRAALAVVAHEGRVINSKEVA